MTTRRLVSGLDLGQAQDPSALVVLEQSATPGKAERDYAVRHLHRWQLGTSYPAIVADLVGLYQTPQMAGTALVVDATGVGRPVVDMVAAAKPRATVASFTITCGLQPGDGTVPKKDLVGAVQAALQGRRLKIAQGLPLADTLAKELETFRVKVTSDRNETFAAWREKDHDDLVLALALALWYAEQTPAVGAEPYGATMTDPVAELPGGTFGAGLPAGMGW